MPQTRLVTHGAVLLLQISRPNPNIRLLSLRGSRTFYNIHHHKKYRPKQFKRKLVRKIMFSEKGRKVGPLPEAPDDI